MRHDVEEGGVVAVTAENQLTVGRRSHPGEGCGEKILRDAVQLRHALLAGQARDVARSGQRRVNTRDERVQYVQTTHESDGGVADEDEHKVVHRRNLVFA